MSSNFIRSAIAAGTPRPATPMPMWRQSATSRLTRAADNASRAPGATFEPWYRFSHGRTGGIAARHHRARTSFPSSRGGLPRASNGTRHAHSPRGRARLYFGTEGGHWDEERVPRPLRVAVRSRLDRGSATGRSPCGISAQVASPASGCRCASTTAGFWPRQWGGCAPS